MKRRLKNWYQYLLFTLYIRNHYCYVDKFGGVLEVYRGYRAKTDVKKGQLVTFAHLEPVNKGENNGEENSHV